MMSSVAISCSPLPENTGKTLLGDILQMFSEHSTLAPNYLPKSNPIEGWRICEDEHFRELPLDCMAHTPYVNLQLQLLSMTLTDIESERKIEGRPSTVNSERKIKDKTQTLLGLGKNKSGRSLNTLRSWSRAPTRFVTRFPLLFNGIKEIKYDFKPYPFHQQHLDAYRGAYTYVLIRNSRQLREAELLKSRFCTNMKTSSGETIEKNQKQSMPQTSAGQPRANIVYYSDICQTGPVCSNAKTQTNVLLKPSDILSSPVSPLCAADSSLRTNTFFFLKSTMEINSMTLLPSQQNEKQQMTSESHQQLKCVKGSGDGRKSSRSRGVRTGKSTFSTKTKQGTIPSRKLASMGRVPVQIRKSTPSIRESRGATLASKNLSIAAGSHTVISPYHNMENEREEIIITKVNI